MSTNSLPVKRSGPNDEITIGLVGVQEGYCLGLGAYFVLRETVGEGCRVIGVADLAKYCREEARAVFKGADIYEDYREMLRDDRIDAIVCGGVAEHRRGRVVLDSLNAGKHVYVTAPMCRYLPEAFEIWDACKRTGKVFQAGVSECVSSKWHKAAELIRAGKIGQPVLAQDSYMRNSPRGEWNYPIQSWGTKDSINWDQWLGDVATRKEFDPDDYFRWPKYYRYSGGVISALLPQRLFPMMLATGSPEFPSRVAAIGTRRIHPDSGTRGTPERDTPENVTVVAEFPSGMSMLFMVGIVNEQGLPTVIRGHNGSLFPWGNTLEFVPEAPFADGTAREAWPDQTGANLMNLFANWLNSIRGTERPVAGIELAIRAQTVLSLAEMSERLKMVCLFDEKTRTIRDGAGREVKPLNFGWKAGES